MSMNRIFVTGLTLTLLALGCSHPPPGRGAGEVENSAQTMSSFKVETVIPNLEVVWSIVWAPDGRMIFTERPGRVRVFVRLLVPQLEARRRVQIVQDATARTVLILASMSRHRS